MIRLAACHVILLIVCAVGFTATSAPAQVSTPPRGCVGDLTGIGNGPPDPGSPGPFGVVIAEYGKVDLTVELPDVDYPVEFLAEVAYPEELECGPFPIVFMMHGGHATCFFLSDNSIDGSWPWPCEAGQEILPNYKGYRYFAEILASHGIIAVSISANSINANDNGDLVARARLFQRHIGQWLEFSTLGSFDFGNQFIDKVDLKRVGIVGHSLGGGAAAVLVDLINTSPSPPDFLSGGETTKIQAILLIAPVTGTEESHRVTDTALGVILPYCDSDENSMPGVYYYDASRYELPGDSGPKHSFEVIGANHNYYNTYWDPNATDIEAKDDWDFLDVKFCVPDNPDSGRLTSLQQRGTLIASGSAFFRTYLRGEKPFLPFLTGEAPPPASALTDQIFVGYHPKDEPEARLDVNRLTEPSEADVNTLSGLVMAGDIDVEFCDAVGAFATSGCLTNLSTLWDGAVPHAQGQEPVNQLRIGWDAGAMDPAYINEIPVGLGDVSGYRALQFRALVDMSDLLNPPGADQDLRIVLVDGAGLAVSAVVSDHSRALFFPPGDTPVGENPVPRAIFNTVRVPLSAFNGVFLTDIRSVEFVFDQTASGAINIADIAFADEAENTPPLLSCMIAENELMATGNKIENVGLSVVVDDDHDAGLAPTINVYSDEDDLDSDNAQSSPDAKDIANGTLRLRAERDKNEDGRVYVVLARAQDTEGALGHSCCTAVVPNGNSGDDLQSIIAQAADARQQCTAFAAAAEGLAGLPGGFFVVGDGPVIGPQQ